MAKNLLIHLCAGMNLAKRFLPTTTPKMTVVTFGKILHLGDLSKTPGKRFKSHPSFLLPSKRSAHLHSSSNFLWADLLLNPPGSQGIITFIILLIGLR
jgi:hypothetical protein